MTDAMHDLLEQAMSATWASLSPATRLRAAQAVADTLATAVVGGDADGVRQMRDQALHWGGRPEATVIRWGDRLPAPVAAGITSAMARAMDYDDCDDETGDHPSVATVPAALAAAEWCGVERMSEVLAGIVAGTEVALRLRRATDLRLSPELPWTTGTYAPLAAAVAAARTVGAGFEEALDAVGIAFTEMSNTCQSQREGALAHRIHQGKAVEAGVASLAYAQRGVRGVREVLEGTFGAFNAFLRGQADRDRLMAPAPLGRWMLDEVSLKPYPACRFTHGPIEAALRIRGEQGLQAADVASVQVAVNRCGVDLCGSEWGPGRSPATGQFSLRYTVARALHSGSVTLGHFAPEAVAAPDVADLAVRVEVIHDPALDANGAQVGPARVTVRQRSGQESTVEVERPYGHPSNPITVEDHLRKVEDCIASADGAIGADATARLRDLLTRDDPGTVGEVVGPFLRAAEPVGR